ncbi:hypothetical protein B0H14DRAFT_3506994 [Mycena olivaceomarginata]|nr:hypothetical protein B0H14DRAFT_3506994 [Mycena olivaceomarginata]
MPFTPPYHTSPGHESYLNHNNNSGCSYYAVWSGRVRGVYTNSWIARDQTDSYTDAFQRAFRKWSDMEFWWNDLCNTHHKGLCLPFELVTFMLSPSPVSHPTSPPCTAPTQVLAPARALVGLALGPAPVPVPVPAPVPAAADAPAHPPAPAGNGFLDAGIRVYPMPAALPFAASRPSSSLSSSSSSASTVKKEEDVTTPKLRLNVPPCVSPLTHVQLTPTPTRYARDMATPGDARALPHTHTAVVTPAGPDPDADPEEPRPSVLAMPGPAAPNPVPAHVPRVVQYGIRGVAVFYLSHATALAVARHLGMEDTKIMVSSNAAKLEAWMLGKSFEGEDD